MKVDQWHKMGYGMSYAVNLFKTNGPNGAQNNQQ